MTQVGKMSEKSLRKLNLNVIAECSDLDLFISNALIFFPCNLIWFVRIENKILNFEKAHGFIIKFYRNLKWK